MTDIHPLTLSQYASVCESLPDPAFILTQSGRYAAILGGKDKRYYHDGSSLVGKNIADVLEPAKHAWFMAQIQRVLAEQQLLVVEYELSAHDVQGLPKEGPVHAIWFEGRISPLQELFSHEPAVLWVASNITASKELQAKFQWQAMSDELTALHNRRRFMQVLEQAYAKFVAQQTPAYLLSFDVDHFKAINDVLGHPAGDQALRDLAAAARKLAGEQDWVCRVGGDEFAILCPGTTAEQVMQMAQQLLHVGRVALQPYKTSGSTPTLSLGLSHFTPADRSVEDIMRRADQALYVSKTQGGHRISQLTR